MFLGLKVFRKARQIVVIEGHIIGLCERIEVDVIEFEPTVRQAMDTYTPPFPQNAHVLAAKGARCCHPDTTRVDLTAR